MPEETPDTSRPRPAMPEDSLKSWNAEASELLSSPGGGPPETSPAPDAAAESLFAVPVDPPGGRVPDALTMRRMLGKGGFGEVWEAVQERLGRTVAVKIVRLDLAGRRTPADPRHQFMDKNLRQEALLAASLDHPNIVPVYDLQDDARGFPALAMKLVRGRAWDTVIREDFAAMTPADFLAKHVMVLIGVAQAVAFAHSRGVVHRDLKPAQVMVGDFGEVLLMDWGLGVVYDPGALRQSVQASRREVMATLHSASSPAGTASYMAPEQTEKTAARIGPWTDVYLLGGTLYQLLTGARPHGSGTVAEVYARARAGIVTPPREARPDRDMPQELVDLCERALSPDPAARHRDAGEFLDELLEYHSGAGRRAQSAELSDEAEALLAGAGGDYGVLARCDTLLGRAHELWPEDERAAELTQRTCLEFARSALERGDLQLARLEAMRLTDDASRGAVLADVDAAALALARRERERRVARIVAGLAMLLILVVTAFYTRRLAESHSATARAQAEAEQLIAGLQEDLYPELESLGRVGTLERFGEQVDAHYTRLDEAARTPESLLRHQASLLALGTAKGRLGDTTAALELAERAEGIAAELLALDPDKPDHTAAMAFARCAVAEQLYVRGQDRRRAGAVARAAAEDMARLEGPGRLASARRAAGVAAAAEDLAIMLLILDGDTESSASLLERAGVLRGNALARDPDNAALRDGRAIHLLRVGQYNVGSGNVGPGLEALLASLELREALVAASPDEERGQREKARLLLWIGRAKERTGETTGALAHHTEALRIHERLAERDPRDLTIRWNQAVSLAKVGEILLDLGDTEGAEAKVSATLGVLDDIPPALAGANHDHQLALGAALLTRGRIRERRGDAAAARADWEAAATAFRRIEASAPYEFFTLRQLAETLLRLDRVAEADEVVAKLRRINYSGSRLDRMLVEKGLRPL